MPLEGLSGREATDFGLQATIAAANDLTVLHVMRDNGLIEATDGFGWTTNSVGIPLPPRSVGCFAHPVLANFFRGTSELESSINQMLGAQPETGGLVNRQVEDRIIDIREARQAFDAVMTQDDYAEIAEVVRQHRERVFSDPRLGGRNSQAVGEIGGVPDPADPRYLDYI